MKLIFTITFLLFLCPYKAQKITSGESLKHANTILNSFLQKKLVREKPKPDEYKKARSFYFYDIDDDGDKDLIAFFTLEGFGGGNNWQHYIAIFVMENSKVKVVDDLILFGDAWKKYHDGELVGFKNGYVYYKLYGSDFETDEKIIKTVGITIMRNKIATTKPL